MKFIVDNKEYILEEGDAIYFDSALKHSIEVVGDTPAISLSVNLNPA
jgi:quercetin dioxygenase-like cupin family protein